MKIAPVAELKARLSRYLQLCAESPVVVTKNGRPTAVLVAVSDEDELERLVLWHTPRFRAILAAADRRIEHGRGIRHEDLWASLQPTRSRTRVRSRADRMRRASKKVGRSSMRVNAEFAAIERAPGRGRPRARDL